jgi:putative ABC transport system ATP-binding protein
LIFFRPHGFPPAEAVLEFRNVRKIHAQGRRDVVALDGVSLRIGRREFVTIMGPSGSGSPRFSTWPAAGYSHVGQVLIEGQATSALGDTDLTLLRRRHIGFVFQFFNLIPSLNIVQNASLPALLGGSPADHVRVRAADLLKPARLESGSTISPRSCRAARCSAWPSPRR